VVRTLLTGVSFLLICVVLSAAASWETKPFMSWSDKELDQVTSESPWAHKINVVLNPLPTPSREDAGGGRGGAGGGDGGGRGGFPTAVPQLRLTIAWNSALPIKQAAVRRQLGQGSVVPAESLAVLERDEPFYVITVAGLPSRYARTLAGMKAESFLKRDKRPPIAATEFAVQQMEQTTLLLAFGFPKDEAITAEDRSVEFITKLGAYDIKRKFNLREMVFLGRLAL
jgi:hypothetical protein